MELSQHNEQKLAALLDDPEFQTIAESESRFNIFDALGTRRQELRHSDFLSFLLDPNKAHGLGSRFLRDFLLRSTESADTDNFFNSIELRLLDFDDVKISREKFNIDILIESSSGWGVLIENKIGAKEHGNQLQTYQTIAETKLGLSKSLFLFLTPDGSAPSGESWSPISHEMIAELCKAWSVDPSVPLRTREALIDYYEFLEAYVIDNSKTAELCRKIYLRHKDALDLIFRHVPNAKDMALTAAQRALQRLEAEGKIVLDATYSGLSRFWLTDIPNIPIAEGEKWTSSRHGILFEWANSNTEFRLDLVIGPIELSIRNLLMRLLQESAPDIYYHYRKSNKYTHIRKETIFDLDAVEYQESEDHLKEIEDEIYAKVTSLLERVGPNLRECIKQAMDNANGSPS